MAIRQDENKAAVGSIRAAVMKSMDCLCNCTVSLFVILIFGLTNYCVHTFRLNLHTWQMRCAHAAGSQRRTHLLAFSGFFKLG